MANQHYSRNKEFNISFDFKVTLNEISNYHHLDENALLCIEEDIQEEITEFLKGKFSGEYNESISWMADRIRFTLE